MTYESSTVTPRNIGAKVMEIRLDLGDSLYDRWNNIQTEVNGRGPREPSLTS